MAQYTPNLHLYKPESTDDFRDFLSQFGINMDILDQGGGGGDGGNYYLNTLYSTEEKKIGYWTDGKPLYQITFTQQLSGITGSIDISALNAEMALIVDGYYDIGVTNIGLNEWLSNGNYSYTHVNNELSPPYIDCYCTWSNSTITVTLQYTKTTDTPEPNPQTGGVIYLPSIYSDEEREVGVWTDGKPLYQITVDQTIGSDADYTVFANGIDHAHLVNSCFEYSSGRWMSFDYISLGATSNSRTCYVDVQNGALKLHNQTNQSLHWIATIQYTKTADVAGSGTWNGQGGVAHHYSENETIVGTWIDGKPLYERSISIAGVSVSTNQTVTIYTQANIKMKYFSGYLTENDITYVIPEIGVRIRQSGDNIQISAQSGASWAISEGYVTIQYTKTTD